MKKRWMVVLCLLITALCVCGFASADQAAVVVDIPTVQAGQDTNFTFSFAQDTLDEISTYLYVSGKEERPLRGVSFSPASGAASYTETVEGYLLQAGEYTWVIRYWDTGSEEYRTTRQSFTVSAGGQPASPTVSMAADQYYGVTADIELLTPSGYEGAIAYQFIPKGAAWENASAAINYIYGYKHFGAYFQDDAIQVGTSEYQLRACVQQDGIWSTWSEPTDFSLSFFGALEEPVITVPSNITIGQDIPFSFVCENAETFTAILYRETEAGSEYITTLQTENGGSTFTGTSGIMDYLISEPGSYKLYIGTEARGYYGNSGEKIFTVKSGTLSEAGPQVVLNEGRDVYNHSSVSIQITMTGMDRIHTEVYDASGMKRYAEQDTAETGLVVRYYYHDAGLGDFTLKVWGHANGQWTQATEIPFTVSERTKLAEPTLTLSANTLEAGTNLTLTFGADPNVYEFIYVIQKQDTAGEWQRVTSGMLHAQESLQSVVDGIELTEAGKYRVLYQSYPFDLNENYRSDEYTRQFTVTAVSQERAAITLGGSPYYMETPFTVNFGQTYDAVRVRAYREGSSYVEQEFSGGYTASVNVRLNSKGSYTLKGTAKKDGRWLPWSEEIHAEIISKGQLAAPVMTLPAEGATAGQDLIVSYTCDEHAQSGNIMLSKRMEPYDTPVFSDWIDVSDSYFIAGYYLSPGNYRITFRLSAPGYESVTGEKEFTVTGEEDPGPTVTLDKETYQPGEQAVITLDKVYEAVWVRTSGGSRTFVNSSSFRWYLPDYSSSVYIMVYTRTNGKWSRNTTKMIPVEAIETLAQSEITVENADLSEDIRIRVSQVEHANRYEIRVYDGNEERVAEAYLSSGGVVTLDQMLFSSGSYRVQANVHGTGYGSSYATQKFQVTGSRSGALPVVTPSDSTFYEDGSTVSFAVSAPGASLVLVKQSMFGDPEAYTVTNGRAMIRRQVYGDSSGEATFRFAAKTDGVWSEWTDPLTITRANRPEQPGATMSDPVLTFSSANPTTGSALKVTLKSDAKAKAYELKLHYTGDPDLEDYDYHASGAISNAAQTVITLPGKELSRSGGYQLEVWTSAPNVKTAYIKRSFAVTGNSIYAPAPEVTLGIEPGNILAGQGFDLTVSSGNGKISAARLIFTTTGNNYESEWNYGADSIQGNTFSIVHSFGEFYIGWDVTLSVVAKIDGVWSESTEPVVFHVLGSQGKVEYPVPALSSASVTAGNPVTVSWAAVDSQKMAGVEVCWYCGDDWHESGELPASATSYTIDTSNLESGAYEVYIMPRQLAAGYVYGDGRTFATFHVKAAGTSQLRTLSLPSAVKEIGEEAFQGTSAQRIVIPAGCTAIRSRAFAFSEQLVSVVIPSSVTSIAQDAFLGCEGIAIETSRNSRAAQFAAAQGFEVIVK